MYKTKHRLEEMVTLKLMSRIRELNPDDRISYLMMCVCDWGLPEYQRDLKNNAEKLFKMMKKLDEKLLNHRMVYQLK